MHIPILLASLAIGLIFGVLLAKLGSGQISINEKLYRGAIYAAAQDHKSAAVHFNKLTEKEISKLKDDERKAVFQSHMLNNRYDQALEANPDGAEELIVHLAGKGNIQMVKNINSTLVPIKYEKAFLQKRYKAVLSLKNDVEMTERRQQQIVEALIMTGDVKGAVKFAKAYKLGHMRFEMERHFEKYVQEGRTTEAQQADGYAQISKMEE
ncbi:hypothetical protein QR721_12205 [Aciduricibacillus chroicocephali]|uniref:Uncharacterized protein n=1 Tax=Aciduricibacillus chroicocephali TaxID=3054939 RepID=A0ABY9KU11_9BACI|nr:hypothetical protein QR721_12205 [Bacillaceae bacterium 44XB]